MNYTRLNINTVWVIRIYRLRNGGYFVQGEMSKIRLEIFHGVLYTQQVLTVWASEPKLNQKHPVYYNSCMMIQ